MRNKLLAALLCLSFAFLPRDAGFSLPEGTPQLGNSTEAAYPTPLQTSETASDPVAEFETATALPTASPSPTAFADEEKRFLTLDQAALSLSVAGEQSAILTAALVPDAPEGAEVVFHWSSADPSVATVSDTGSRASVTAVHGGATQLIVSASSSAWENELRAECEVRVNEPVRNINLSTGLLTLTADASERSVGRLAFSIEPDTHTETVHWRVEQDEEAVSFDAVSGAVHALREGTALLIAETSGGVSARCRVLVRAAGALVLESAPTETNSAEAAVPSANALYSPQMTQTRSLLDLSLPAWETRLLRSEEKAELTPLTALPDGEPSAPGTAAPSGKAALFDDWDAAVGIRLGSDPVALGAGIALEDEAQAADQPTWRSSDRRVARVDQQGNVQPVKVGKATITVTVPGGGQASTLVTVYKKEALSARLRTEPRVKLSVGETLLPSVSFSPMHSYAALRWSTSDSAVAVVDSESGLITAVNKGATVVSADAPNLSSPTLSLTVEVVAPIQSLAMYADSLRDDASWLALPGQSRALEVVPEPAWEQTSDTVTWSSSNARVASVDKRTGKVTAHKQGNAVITAKATSGAKATCRVRVVRPAESIALPEGRIFLKNGETHTLRPTLTPRNNTDVLSWSSSDPEVAVVSATGVVTALAKGEALLTVTTLDGLSVHCAVTVLEAVE